MSKRFNIKDVVSQTNKVIEDLYKTGDTIKNFLLLLTAVIGGIVGVVTFSIDHPKVVQAVLVLGNLAALGYWLKKTNPPELNFAIDSAATEDDNDDKSDGRQKYCELLSVDLSNQSCFTVAETNNKRVNKLVKQLNVWIICYAFSLIFVYFVFLIDNEMLWSWWHGNLDSYNLWHRYFKILEDIFNFLSALFLYLGFKVLYNRTLDTNSEPKKYYLDGVILSSLFIFLYLVSSLFFINSPQNNNLSQETVQKISNITATYTNKGSMVASNSIAQIKDITDASNSNQNINKPTDSNSMDRIREITNNYHKEINIKAADSMKETISAYERGNNLILLNLFGLFIGIANGMAMSLLFGRYISMEHLINNRKDEEHFNIYSIGTVFLLPIYALAQPLFGSFEINAFGPAAVFANCVFFICMIGKIFFLYFTYQLMKDRSLHYYLHLVITSHGIPKDFANCFESAQQTPTEPDKTAQTDNIPI